jgi:hypothetical protein
VRGMTFPTPVGMMKKMKINPREIRRFVDVSSAHITENDAQLLTEYAKSKNSILIVMEYNEGCWLYVPLSDMLDQKLAAWARAGLSKALCDLVRAARAEGIDYLKIDADGGHHEGFPEFDW